MFLSVSCSKESLQGMCAAHWAALQAAVQVGGGLQGCSILLPHIVADLRAVGFHCPALLVHTPLPALFSEAVRRLAPDLWQVCPLRLQSQSCAASSNGAIAQQSHKAHTTAILLPCSSLVHWRRQLMQSTRVRSWLFPWLAAAPYRRC